MERGINQLPGEESLESLSETGVWTLVYSGPGGRAGIAAKVDLGLNAGPASEHSEGLRHSLHPVKHAWSFHTPSEQSASPGRWAGPRAQKHACVEDISVMYGPSLR